MAINLNELEASGKRWEPPSADYPQGKFINGTGEGKRNGSYCKAEWANDIFGFLGALLHNAGLDINGQVETARNSQFYNALVKVIDTLVSKAGVRYDKAQGLKDGEKRVARENIGAVSAATDNETALGSETKKAVTPSSLKKMLDSTLVRTTAQTLTSTAMAQARANIGATDADTVLNRSTSMLPYAFYNGEGRTVGELVAEMQKWVKATANKVPTAFTFNAGGAWINAWNTGNPSYVMPTGNSWAAVKIGFPFADYTALLISDYIENYLFYAIFQAGKLKSIRPVVFSASNIAVPSCSSHVVSSYQASDGTLWYRKYSDGWIEQGGNPGGVGNQGMMDTTITFPVPFTNTNYFIGGVGFVISNVGSAYISSATTTGFTTSSVMHKSGTPSWYACGY